MRLEDIAWDRWVPREKATLMFIRQADQLLLIEKKRGLGAGYYNAAGGHLEPGESWKTCAIREIQEELCITPHSPQHVGTLQFQFVDGLSIQGEVFLATSFDGVPTETDEAVPVWFSVHDLPWDNMWADDAIWYPKLLANERFTGRFLFDGKTMLDYALV